MIGTIHTDEEIVVKIKALTDDCKEINRINKVMRKSPKYTESIIDYKIESMYALAMELDREINPTNLEGDDV